MLNNNQNSYKPNFQLIPMFKINLSTKDGKTYKLEAEVPALEGKSLGDKISGKDVSPDLEEYELEITGASDKSGFTAMANVEGMGRKKVLLSYEKAMKTRPKKEGKFKRTDKTPKGLRLRKTVRGKIISEAISQINMKILKDGSKKLAEVFPDQNKTAEEAPAKTPAPETAPTEESAATSASADTSVDASAKPSETPKEEPKKEKVSKEEASTEVDASAKPEKKE